MLRGLLAGVGGSIGMILIIIAAIYVGLKSASWIMFFIILIGGFFGMIYLAKYLDKLTRKDMTQWLADHDQCVYKYAYDGTGVAVDKNKEVVYLSSKFDGQFISKSYEFSKIREWGYDIPGHTVFSHNQVYGGGVSGAAHNFGSAVGTGVANAISLSAKIEKSGFLVTVADVDYPEWFIKFQPSKSFLMDLKRWMEIFNQCINKN